ncbi:LTA synthase family protein [Streptococcus sinensis]|uniref:LTA synthase family protein n=1 Tax=Streptococcus sinensis TaxID=176090 RepID=UPI001F254133|nr:alkaline phosphatase family protein [Streptococcus sinensis]MCF1283961.1 sulfatase-like hydrolase/transferase [Streptococcus sinensis]
MKLLINYYKQISYLLISFLFLDITAVITLFLLQVNKNIENYSSLGFVFLGLIVALFGLGQIVSQLLSRKLLIWSAIVYASYILFSYLLTVTQHINDFDFKTENLLSNHFFQVNGLPYLLLIFFFAYLINYFPSLKKYNSLAYFIVDKYNKYFLEKLFLSQSLIFLSLTDDKMTGVFQHQSLLTTYLTDKGFEISQDSILKLIGFIILLFLLFLIPSFLGIKGLKDISKNRGSFSVAVLCSAVLSVIFNYTIQNSIRGDVSVLELHLFAGASLFQIAVFFAAFIFIYLVFNQIFLASIIILATIILATIASSLKFQYRHEPILPSDVSWLKNPKILFDFLGGNYGIYTIAGLAALGAFYWFFRRRILPGKILSMMKMQLMLLAFPIIFFLGILQIFSSKENGKVADNIPVISILNNYHDLTWFGNTVNSQMRSISFVWFTQLSDKAMIQPAGYSKEKIQEIEKKYGELADSINQERQHNIEQQTVIYVLSESFSDPARIDGVSMSENPIPNIQEIMSKTTSGLMQSDGYGGGTANMEFQTLTGLPFYNLSPSVSVIYTEVVPKMNKLPAISDFYTSQNRTVIHLASPSNYSRDIIYKDLGYDTFIHYGTQGLQGDHIGGNYSDKTTYNQVLDRLKTDQSQFFSVMTMQNHMPWTEVNPIYMSASYPGFTEAGNKSLSSYVRMLYHTDNATKDFLDKLSKIDKKITVVFYGDHLPGLYPQSAFKDHPENQFLTDYFIWSNYETPKLDYPLVNSSDFSALLLEQTNSKVSPYYALLTEVLHKASVDKKALEPSAQEIADDLKLIEYDMVGGKGYLSKDFFAMPAK